MERNNEVERWQNALQKLWCRNRVHVGRDMSAAYRDLAAIYPNTTIIGYPSGENREYWTAPPAWEVDKAQLVDPDGTVLADWHDKPLSLFTYSPPFRGEVTLEELEDHLFSIAQQPDVTAYHFLNQYREWDRRYGFCLPHAVRQALKPGKYMVDIQTRFENGTMEMVEQVHRGELDDSVLLIGHFDHPYMCNDGLVGCLCGHEIVTRLQGRKTKLTYRMLSTVEIVGSVFYAADHAHGNRVRNGLFVATSGALAPFAYQESFEGSSPIDRVLRHVLRFVAPETPIARFRDGPLGNDEIAYDVSGVDIPCGSLMRGPYAQYHTEHDDLDHVDAANFEEMASLVLRAINILEKNATLHRKFSVLPRLSHPDLGLYLSPAQISNVTQAPDPITRELVENLDGASLEALAANNDTFYLLMTYLPAMANGDKTVLDLAERVDLPFEIADAYSDMWVKKGLLEKRWVNPFSE